MTSSDIPATEPAIPESDEADRIEQSIPVDTPDDGIDEYPHAAEEPEIADDPLPVLPEE